MITETFFHRIWGKSSGYAFVCYKDGTYFQQQAYAYPKQAKTIVQDLKYHNKTSNIWFSVHLFNDTERKKKNALPIQSLWVDIDDKSILPESILPKPTICWQTSKGKHQAVWILDKPIEPVRAEKINKYLTYKIGGDKGKWALTTILRFPESLNYKYDPPEKGFIVWDDGPEYSIDEIEPKDLDLKELAESIVDTIKEMPEDLPTEAQAYKRYGKVIPYEVWKILDRKPTKEDDWSTTMYKMEIQMAENGIPPEYIFAIMNGSAWNKYVRDGRPPEHLWHEVVKVCNEAKIQTPEPDEKITGLNWLSLNTLLRYTRQPEWLVQDIWMDENVGWLAGVGKSYKSTLSLDLALSVASGLPFLGRFEVHKPGPVLMVQEEDPDWRVATRLQSIAEAKSISNINIVDNAKQFTMEIIDRSNIPLYCSIGKGFTFTDDKMCDDLERAMSKYKPRMVILDPLFMMSAGVDEYKASEVSVILNKVKKWRNDFGCSFCIVHHYRKGAMGEAHEKVYGSMALYAWSENSLFVSRRPGTQTVIDIQRDIKDALVSERMSVDFGGTDDERGAFKVILDSVAISKEGSDSSVSKIIRYIKDTYGRKTLVTKQELVEQLNLTDKTVQRALAHLKKNGLIEVDYKGTGGQATIKPNAEVFELEAVFDI